MRISYNEEKDVLSLMFTDTGMLTRDAAEGITADFDSEGRITRIDIQDAVARFAGRDVFRQIVLEGIGPITHNEPLIILPRLIGEIRLVDDGKREEEH